MKELKIKAWLKKEKKMVSIIGIDFNYEYIRYTEDDIYGLISYDDEDGTYRVSYENITEHLSDREGDFEIVGNIFENPDLHEQLGY